MVNRALQGSYFKSLINEPRTLLPAPAVMGAAHGTGCYDGLNARYKFDHRDTAGIDSSFPSPESSAAGHPLPDTCSTMPPSSAAGHGADRC